MRRGDWTCTLCAKNVYSHKLQCPKCGNHRYSKSAKYLNIVNELSPSYWVCLGCDSRWQSDVKKCMKCN